MIKKNNQSHEKLHQRSVIFNRRTESCVQKRIIRSGRVRIPGQNIYFKVFDGQDIYFRKLQAPPPQSNVRPLTKKRPVSTIPK